MFTMYNNCMKQLYHHTTDTYFGLPISFSGYVFNSSMYSSASVANKTCFTSPLKSPAIVPAILFETCSQGDTAEYRNAGTKHGPKWRTKQRQEEKNMTAFVQRLGLPRFFLGVKTLFIFPCFL